MVRGCDVMVFQNEEGAVANDPDTTERTVKEAVAAAVFAERKRCAEIARKAWMTHDMTWNMSAATCEIIAALIEKD